MIFLPVGTKKIDASLLIYNCWGQNIAEVKDLQKVWDGKHDGKKCTDGTYWVLLNKLNDVKMPKNAELIEDVN